MRTYVVPMDFSKSAMHALDYAIVRARRRKAKMILVHVVSNQAMAASGAVDPSSAQLIVKAQEAAKIDAKNRMHALVERKRLAKNEFRIVISESLDPAGAIAEQARKSRARMIIMGSEGRKGVNRIFSGSVAEATLRATNRPLLIIKQSRQRKPPAKIILVPVDHSEVSLAALRAAKEIANAEREKLLLMHVVTETDRMVPIYLRAQFHRSVIKEEQQRLQKLAGRLKITAHQWRVVVIRARDAAVTIAKEAKRSRASMIVMGSHGRSGLMHFVLGSTAGRTLRHASCPVLIMKPRSVAPSRR